MEPLDRQVHKHTSLQVRRMRPNPEPNHLFTPYVITKTNETVYFALLNVPAKLYTSEEIIAVTTRCYNGLLLPMSFKQLDHDFHSASYLIQSNKNVLGLHRLLSIKKDCGQTIKEQLLQDLFEFVVQLHTCDKWNRSQIGIQQIGIDAKGKMCLADPLLYFKYRVDSRKQCEGESVNDHLTFICQQIVSQFGTVIESEQKLFALVENFGSNEAKPEQQSIYQSSFIQNSTMTTSFIDSVSEPCQQKVKLSFHSQSISVRPTKLNTKVKIIIAVVLVLLLSTAGYFCVTFFERSIVCREGQYISENKQCLSCTTGCLRCTEGTEDKCLSCISSMYLVLNQEGDIEGRCLAECQGRKLRDNYCINGQKKVYNLEADNRQSNYLQSFLQMLLDKFKEYYNKVKQLFLNI